jgi:S-adenosylmethionine-dependent methyltransferase
MSTASEAHGHGLLIDKPAHTVTDTDTYGALAATFVDHYSTLRGVVRRELVLRQLGEHMPAAPARVADIGGGAGHVAIPLASQGHDVTVVDPSGEMLARCRDALERCTTAVSRRVTLIECAGEDAPSALGHEAFDAVLCHGVLMYLDEPGHLARALAALCRRGGVISVVAKNAAALALRPALQGRFRDALGAFEADRDVGGLGVVTRGDTVAGIARMLGADGVDVVAWYGVRVLSDHRIGEPPGSDVDDVLEAEWEAGRRDPYRAVARLIHVIGRKVLTDLSG